MQIYFLMEFVESRSSIWQGAGIGLTVSALNHVAHRMSEQTDKVILKEDFQSSNNNDDAGIIPIGKIIFEDLSKKQLGDFRVIPEDGQPYKPTKNGTYEGDGFYHRNFSDERYWYKVSAGSSVTISYSKNQYIFSGVSSSFWEFAAHASRKYYNVGLEPKSRRHWTNNPFDLNQK